MSNNQNTISSPHPTKEKAAPHFITHRFRRLLGSAIQGGPSHETLGELSIISLSDDTSYKHQHRQVMRLMREIPANRCRLVIDLAKFKEGNHLSRLVYDIVDQAKRCRLNICIGGVSKQQEVLLELTRINQIVCCYSSRSEAIGAFLQQSPPNANPCIKSLA